MKIWLSLLRPLPGRKTVNNQSINQSNRELQN
jgi:hypothetical protein